MATLLLLGALPQEIDAYQHRLTAGRWHGHRVEVVATGVGKVAAAAATRRAIDTHRPDALVFTGVAGALDPRLALGQVGVAHGAIDADFDIRAWMPGVLRGEHPFGGGRVFPCHDRLVAAALGAAVPGLFEAYLATGSAFLDRTGKADFRRTVLPDLAAEVGGRRRTPDLIDMETSAVLQVAATDGLPALALRAVSDTCEGDAVADFNAFLDIAIQHYEQVVDHLLQCGVLETLSAARRGGRARAD